MKNLDHIKDVKCLMKGTIEDNKKVIKDIKNGAKIDRNMGVWHKNRIDSDVCSMCMAGAVIRESLSIGDGVNIAIKATGIDNKTGGDIYTISNKDISTRDVALLTIIDDIRNLMPLQLMTIPSGFDMLNYGNIYMNIKSQPTLSADIKDGDVEAWEVMYGKIK